MRCQLFLLAMAVLSMAGRVLAQAPPSAAPTPDDARVDAFWEAAFVGRTDVVARLLDEGLAVNALSADQRSALMWAAFNGHEKTVQLLMDRGADPSIRDSEGRTALMYASTAPSPAAMEMLIKAGSDVNLTDKIEGFTALMFAAGEGMSDAVKILLAAGADATIKDVDGDTAQDFARRNGHAETVRILESHVSPADASATDRTEDRATEGSADRE